MIKVTIDMDKCQHYGQCCFEAPDVFALDADGKITYVAEVADDRRDDVESAADVCPMQAIEIS
jgi:ferredoxin